MFEGLSDGDPRALADLVWVIGMAIAVLLLIKNQKKKKKKEDD